MRHPAGGGTVPLSHANVTLSNQSGPDLLPLPDEVRIAEITRRLLPLFELSQAALGDRPPGAIPAQPLKADSVVAVNGGVSMQRKPLGDGHSLPTVTRRRHLKGQACLNGLLLEPLEVVLCPGLLQLTPVGPRLAQGALQNSGDIVVARGLELDALA